MAADNITLHIGIKPVLTISNDDALVFHDQKDRRIMIKKGGDNYMIYKERFDTDNRPYWDSAMFVGNASSDPYQMLHEVITMIYKLKNKETDNFTGGQEI